MEFFIAHADSGVSIRSEISCDVLQVFFIGEYLFLIKVGVAGRYLKNMCILTSSINIL